MLHSQKGCVMKKLLLLLVLLFCVSSAWADGYFYSNIVGYYDLANYKIYGMSGDEYNRTISETFNLLDCDKKTTVDLFYDVTPPGCEGTEDSALLVDNKLVVYLIFKLDFKLVTFQETYRGAYNLPETQLVKKWKPELKFKGFATGKQVYLNDRIYIKDVEVHYLSRIYPDKMPGMQERVEEIQNLFKNHNIAWESMLDDMLGKFYYASERGLLDKFPEARTNLNTLPKSEKAGK